MLFFTRWKAAAIVITALIVCLFTVPNFFPESVVQKWPSWAQRHVVLGLDLQGGSSLLLQVDTNAVRKEQLQALDDDVLRVLRRARIPFTGRTIHGNDVEVHVTRNAEVEVALNKLRELSQPLTGILGATGQNSLDISLNGGLIALSPSNTAITERIRQAVDQSIEIIQRRVNELGLVEPTIQREGTDRILVQVPGLQDPTRLKEILGKTAKLDFRMIDLSMAPEQAATHPPENSEILQGQNGGDYLVEKRVLVSGADLVDAQPGFDPRTNEPVINFRFNSTGARKFAEATEQNVGRPFAIVLDNKVVSAPLIREPTLGGQGEISGNFTVQQANDLAILLRAGALPAPLTIVEENTVGPGLGQDSIRAGEHAAYMGAAFVILFMLMTYGLFGLFANIAVGVNVAMIFGVLSMLNATLTLPGIAGSVSGCQRDDRRASSSSSATGFTQARLAHCQDRSVSGRRHSDGARCGHLDERAQLNFEELPLADVADAYRKRTVPVEVKVEHDDFREVRFYKRGRHVEQFEVREWFGLRRREVNIEVFDDIVLLVAMKTLIEIGSRRELRILKRRKIVPGSVLFKYFRNIACGDLYALFPNARVVMSNFDKAFLGVPAIAGGIPILVKLYATISVLFLVIGIYFGGSGAVSDIEMKAALAALMGLVALGGFVMHQWLKYRHQAMKYHMEVNENLYFRNVNNNAGIFDYLIAAAEDQETKEAVLAYHFIGKAEPAPTAAEIAVRIETWLAKNFGVTLDFKIADALKTLNRFRLVRRQGERLFVPPLEPAIAQLHQVWNNFFKREQSCGVASERPFQNGYD